MGLPLRNASVTGCWLLWQGRLAEPSAAVSAKPPCLVPPS